MNLDQKLIVTLIFGCIFLSLFIDNEENFNSSSPSSPSSLQSIVKLTSELRNSSSQNPIVPQTLNKREMLFKHFPDWQARMDYQKKQEEFFKSAILRKRELQRKGITESRDLYTKQELDLSLIHI